MREGADKIGAHVLLVVGPHDLLDPGLNLRERNQAYVRHRAASRLEFQTQATRIFVQAPARLQAAIPTRPGFRWAEEPRHASAVSTFHIFLFFAGDDAIGCELQRRREVLWRKLRYRCSTATRCWISPRCWRGRRPR